MTVTRSVLLFVLAAVAEIGGAWLIRQGVRERRGCVWMGAGGGGVIMRAAPRVAQTASARTNP